MIQCHLSLREEHTALSKGDNGFGYDDMFYPTGLDESFASIDNKLKAQLSHRGKAIKKMIDALKEA